jgi:ABC-type transporter Mla subunit MlaD
MKRVLAIAGVLLAASALVVFAGGAGDDGGTYRVRAIFMNAFSVIPGEDVKIAGVKVGKVESLDVTPDHKAAVVLRIDRAGFDDFRTDAECAIRPQSLIGEKFVECTPTQPRPDGAQPAPKLRRIDRGDGEGQYLLPVSQTSKPVDLDLVNNTLRLPYRERLAVILNELGTGLAGRGDDLRLAIRNADPALKETDKVLKILADQNQVLANLARDGDAILTPLARDRSQVADFVSQANTTAQATAERSSALEQNIVKLPSFLRELRPTMQRLGGLADQMTPVLSDLGSQAPAINRWAMPPTSGARRWSRASRSSRKRAGSPRRPSRWRTTSQRSRPR